jgi:phosphoesterase RecJ-like protein
MDKSLIIELKKLLSKKQKIVIIPHKNPDGDAIGSSLALMHFLNSKLHESFVVSPNDYPSFLKWLPGEPLILKYNDEKDKIDEIIKKSTLIFALDFNDLSRIGDLSVNFENSSAKKIMIDHHESPNDFAEIIFSDTKMSSTCEMVFDIINKIDSNSINKDIATCLYTGIMTDTGSFRYPLTTAKTHNAISKLIENGAKISEIHQNVYDNFSFSKMILLGIALSNIKKVKKIPAVYMTLTQKELDDCNFKKGDTEGFVNYGLNLKGIRLSVIMIENKLEGIIKMSFRSTGAFSVNSFARKFFNGGGHISAAGGMSLESMSNTINHFLNALELYKNEF